MGFLTLVPGSGPGGQPLIGYRGQAESGCGNSDTLIVWKLDRSARSICYRPAPQPRSKLSS
jgi:hypothetical protein